ncbi:MAG: MATE family efflux transporter [Candidatus Merdivicinus sp.]
MVKEKEFYRSLFIVALPAAFQGLISLGVNMLDNLMVGSLGDLTLASVSLANQATGLFTFFVNGIGGGAAVLISQYWGKRDFDKIRRIFGVILRFAAIAALLICVLISLFPEQTMRIFTNDPEMIQAGIPYLRIVCLSYPLFAVSNTMVVMLRWMEIVRIGLIISCVSLAANFCFNSLLIFGLLGFPALGAQGAAIATVIARLLELSITAYYLFVREKRVRFRLKDFFTHDREMAGDFLRHSVPIIVGDSQWGLIGTAKAMMIGRLGVTMVSANAIADVFLSLALIFTNGLANGACVVIGKSVGEKDYAKTRRYSNTIQIIFAGLGVLVAGVVLLMSLFVPNFYNVSQQTKDLAATFLVIGAFTHLGTCYHAACFTGINRGAGDGKFVMKVDMICGWLVVVPLTFLSGFIWHWPLWAVYLCTRIDQCFKWIIAIIRLKGNRWIRNVTRD